MDLHAMAKTFEERAAEMDNTSVQLSLFCEAFGLFLKEKFGIAGHFNYARAREAVLHPECILGDDIQHAYMHLAGKHMYEVWELGMYGQKCIRDLSGWNPVPVDKDGIEIEDTTEKLRFSARIYRDYARHLLEKHCLTCLKPRCTTGRHWCDACLRQHAKKRANTGAAPRKKQATGKAVPKTPS